MKKIVMIVPDQVKIISEIRSNIYSKNYDVTDGLIIQMFSRKTDYHEDIYFEDTQNIRIESIDDVN
jgi:hypothetical protein